MQMTYSFQCLTHMFSLPNLMKEVDCYGALSNLKINYTKSEGMGTALPPSLRHTLQLNFNFKWVPYAMKYLGNTFLQI